MSTTFTWKATIRTEWGAVEVTICAPNQHVARKMIQSQYGKGKILSNIVQRV